MPAHADPGSFARLRALFDEATTLPPSELEPFLLQLDSSDPTLADRLRHLLAHHHSSSSLLDRSLPARLGLASARPSVSPSWLGSTLKNRYTLICEVGRGGSSLVFLASDSEVAGRQVVVKILTAGSLSPGSLDTELSALAALHHPAIITPKDTGATPSGFPFLVLEYIPGPTLRQALGDKPFPVERLLPLLRGLSSALEAAHALDTWHLDLKPENILLRSAGTPSESPALLDFGIAHAASSAQNPTAGSPRYMAPEQRQGRPCAASDQYALALICLEALTGQRPSSPPDLSALPHAARAPLSRALQSDPALRFPSIQAFTLALSHAIDPQRRKTLLLRSSFLALLAGGILLTALIVFALRREQTRRIKDDMELLATLQANIAGTVYSNTTPSIESLHSLAFVYNRLDELIRQGHHEHSLLKTMTKASVSYGALLGDPSVRSIGTIHQSLPVLRRAVEIADLDARVNPFEDPVVSDPYTARHQLATVLVEAGLYDEALSVTSEALRLLDAVPPGRRQPLLDRAVLLMTRSRVFFHRRQWDQCLALRNQAISIIRFVTITCPGTACPIHDLAGMLATRGYTYRDMGRLDLALADYDESDRLLATLIHSFPSNVVFLWLALNNHLEVGRLHLLAGRPTLADQRLSACLEQLKKMLPPGPPVGAAIRTVALTHSWLAVARHRVHAPRRQVLTLARESLHLIADAAAADPLNAKIRDERDTILRNAHDVGYQPD